MTEIISVGGCAGASTLRADYFISAVVVVPSARVTGV